jgi:hypothetical protein
MDATDTRAVLDPVPCLDRAHSILRNYDFKIDEPLTRQSCGTFGSSFSDESLRVSPLGRADSNNSQHPTTAGGTRPTMAEHSYGYGTAFSPLHIPKLTGPIEDRFGQHLSRKPPTVPQQNSLADTSWGAAPVSLSYSPGVSPTATRSESDSVVLPSDDNYSFADSTICGKSGSAGSSRSNALSIFIPSSHDGGGIRSAITEDSPRPKLPLEKRQSSSSRIRSWLGRRNSKKSPLQEFSSSRIIRPSLLVPVSEAVEMWSLDNLIDRWITRSSGESAVVSSMVILDVVQILARTKNSRICSWRHTQPSQTLRRFLKAFVFVSM